MVASHYKTSILSILETLYKSVLTEGGDGDGIWYARFLPLDYILTVLHEYNSSLKSPWEIQVDEYGINWGEREEGVRITNNKEWFDATDPSWYLIKIQF